jgi:hypothetical protein
LSSPVEGKLQLMARATAFFLTLLTCGALLLAVASPASSATKPCWKQVVDDWSQDGSIDGSYSAACIDEALAKVPEDIRAYSDFEEQAKGARLAAGRSLQSVGGVGGATSSGSGDSSSGSGSGETQPVQEREPETGPKDESPIGWALRTNGNNADSFPLPLLILLVLAGALITAGGVGFGARKLQARRVTP